MRTLELFLQGCFFTISCLTLQFLLPIAVHFPAGRVLFAVFYISDLFGCRVLSLFKVARFLWRWSSKAAIAMVRIFHPSEPSATLLTETKKTEAYINARGEA